MTHQHMAVMIAKLFILQDKMEKKLIEYVEEAAAEWLKDHEPPVQADKKTTPNNFDYRLSALAFWESSKLMARAVDRLLNRTT